MIFKTFKLWSHKNDDAPEIIHNEAYKFNRPRICVLNIDEVIFSRSTKSSYSWLDRGVWWSRANISFKGSVSLIWAIIFRENWYATNLTSHYNSQTFTEFIQKLESGLKIIWKLKEKLYYCWTIVRFRNRKIRWIVWIVLVGRHC